MYTIFCEKWGLLLTLTLVTFRLLDTIFYRFVLKAREAEGMEHRAKQAEIKQLKADRLKA